MNMITSTILDNGVRVITEHVEHMHTVSIGIWVANGSRHESPDTNGVAHFIEHLLFKGTGRLEGSKTVIVKGESGETPVGIPMGSKADSSLRSE